MSQHVVCRDCPFEQLIEGALAADRAVVDHEEETGHELDQDYVTPAGNTRPVTDGGPAGEQ